MNRNLVIAGAAALVGYALIKSSRAAGVVSAPSVGAAESVAYLPGLPSGFAVGPDGTVRANPAGSDTTGQLTTSTGGGSDVDISDALAFFR